MDESRDTLPTIAESWDTFYCSTEWRGGVFAAIKSPAMEWPEGVQVWAGSFIREARVMVPEVLVHQVIEAQHRAGGYFSRRCLLCELRCRFLLPPNIYMEKEEVARGRSSKGFAPAYSSSIGPQTPRSCDPSFHIRWSSMDQARSRSCVTRIIPPIRGPC